MAISGLKYVVLTPRFELCTYVMKYAGTFVAPCRLVDPFHPVSANKALAIIEATLERV